MRQVAISFATTGPSPRGGHRICEIVLVGQKEGTQEGRMVRFRLLSESGVSEPARFATVLPELKSFVGDATVVVSDAGKWRRFLRAELRTIRRHGAGRLLNELVDVSSWAHQRFPRQRRNVAAIARRMGIEVDKELIGLEREAELLRLIARGMNTSMERSAQQISEPNHVLPSKVIGTAERQVTTKVAGLPTRKGWVERFGLLWRRLSGKM